MSSGWEFATSQIVPFVREIDEWIAIRILCSEAALVHLDLIDHCFGLFSCIVTQRRQIPGLKHVVVFRQSNRYNGDRLDNRTQLRQVMDTAVKMRAIINRRTQYKLRMTADAHASKALDMIDDVSCSWAINHLAPQVGIGCMH